jgi:hypothetical protein
MSIIEEIKDTELRIQEEEEHLTQKMCGGNSDCNLQEINENIRICLKSLKHIWRYCIQE